MLFIGIIILGAITLSRMPLELLPNTSFGEVSVIYLVRGGVPPDKIETQVVKPVEEAVGSVSNLKDIISISKDGMATIVLKFAAETDMNVAVMEVREKLSQIKNILPREVERPIIAQYEQEDIPIVILGVTSEFKAAEEIRKIVDTKVKERISRVPGVANVEVYGGRERKIIVEVLPDKLHAYNLALGDVINGINQANVSLLAGDVEGSGSQFNIKTTGRFETIEDIRNLGIAVSDEGSIVRLKDIAKVEDSYMEAENLSRFNSDSNVTIYIQKETLASTTQVARDILNSLEDIKKVIPSDLVVSVIKNDAVYIEKAIRSMKISLVIGAALAVAVLFFFMKKISLASIIFLSIPTSIFLAIIILHMKKVTLNIMTLGGLALGVGMLLDNSIVVIENIFRSLRSRSNSDSRKDAIAGGTSQIILPIIAGTLTTIIVFLPLLFLSADISQMQGDMAMAITCSLVASLFVSLTLIPLLFYHLGFKAEGKEGSEGGLYLKYKNTLDKTLGKKKFFIGGSLILFALAVFFFMRIDMNLFETQEENKFTINVELPTGAKLEVSNEKVQQVENLLMEYADVKSVSSKVEKWSSKVLVTLKEGEKRKKSKEEIMEELRPKFEEIQPAFIYFQEAQELAAKEIFVELYGIDYGKMKELAQDVGGYMKAVPELVDVKIRMREGRPEKVIVLDRRKVALTGLSIGAISENLHARLRGLVATRFHESGREIETIVRQCRETIDSIRELDLVDFMTAAKNYIKLPVISEIKDGRSPSEIWRKNKRRIVQVSATRKGISLEKAAEKVREALKNVKFPEGYLYEIGGDYELMMRSKKELLIAFFMTVLLIYMLLASIFESYLQPFIIMVAVPLSFIGVVAALMITKTKISIGVIMGMIMLAGIVVNNSIMLVDRINLLKTSGVKDYITAACSHRLRPILMTVSTTILGLLPLALKGGEGSGLWQPMAITVISGLVTSTFLVLFIVPAIYDILRKKDADNRISS